MFWPLPAETVYEARRRTRVRTRVLLAFLIGIYLVFFHLLAFVAFGLYSERVTLVPPGWKWFLGVTVAAIVAALIHFDGARSRPLRNILGQLSASGADPKDDGHVQFINIVKEAEAATGIRPIHAVTIPVPACNAFSVTDGRNQSAIGVTEGLLAKLDRSELSAVVAHEAAHIVHGDSRLLATACSLFSVFDKVASMFEGSGRYSSRRDGGRLIVLWLIALLGRQLTALVHMAISREREYFADSDAVALCKDPLSLASALKKISTAYRGTLHVPESFSAVFILNPAYSALDETENFTSDLLSTHPPVERRIEKLTEWAKSSLVGTRPTAGVYAHAEGRWSGPHPPEKLVAEGTGPQTLVGMGGPSPAVAAAAAVPMLHEFFEKNLKGTPSKWDCPRCAVRLVESKYEGAPAHACEYCHGWLLSAASLQKIIARRDKTFTPEEIKKTQEWRLLQKGFVKDLCKHPHIKCPVCERPMFKSFHSGYTNVVIDRCLNESCGYIWCDAEELERIQILVEHGVPLKPAASV